MKILFVTTCYPSSELPQYCVFLEQQAQALKNMGHMVDVLIPVECADCDQSIEKVIYHGIEVTKCRICAGKKKDILFPTKLNSYDHRQMAALITGKCYDVVSFHFGGLRIVRSVLEICKKNRIKYIHHFHGLNVWYEFHEAHKYLEKYFRIQKYLVYRSFDAVVGVSNKVCQQFSMRIKNVPHYTVYNGVDTERFLSYDRKFFQNGKIRILCVANLIPLKGQDYLIDAVSGLTEKGLNVELILAGRGPDEQKLKEQAKRRNLLERVHFVGYVPYEEIADLMSACDLFVMPSYYEALGCVYLEAMSAGMITVGVWNQGIDEIIADGKNGFLVQEKSVADLERVLQKIIGLNHSELKQISCAAIRDIEKYTWKESAAELNKVYLDVLSKEQ